MKATYDQQGDILFLIVKDGQLYDGKELGDDVRIEYDKEGQIGDIEVFNTRDNLFKVLA
jgi:uncharacterized protein YuzE